MGDRRLRVLALASYPVEAAASRWRVVQFIEPLRSRGVDVTFSPFLDRQAFTSLYGGGATARAAAGVARGLARRIPATFSARSYDAVLIQREAALAGPPLVEWVVSRILSKPVVLDLDDATYVPYTSPTYGRWSRLAKPASKADRLIGWSDVVACGSRAIVAHVEGRGARAVLVPASVDLGVFRPSGRSSVRPAVTLGWVGSHSTWPYVETILPAIVEAAGSAHIRLVVIGSGKTSLDLPGVEVELRAWKLEREIADFADIDIGLYPIGDGEWARGKSGLKAVQYLAMGIPFVVSPVGEASSLGIPGETHIEARTLPEWTAALRRLAEDPALRTTMGRSGRRHAESHYSIEKVADLYEAAIRDAIRHRLGSSPPLRDSPK